MMGQPGISGASRKIIYGVKKKKQSLIVSLTGVGTTGIYIYYVVCLEIIAEHTRNCVCVHVYRSFLLIAL